MSYSLPPSVIKSNYNFKCCPGCNKPIKRGDLITFVAESLGMLLRPVVCKHGFYTPCTGRRIVHRDCDVIGLWTNFGAELESNNISGMNNYDYCDLEYYSDEGTNYDYCDDTSNNSNNNKNSNKNSNKNISNAKNSWFW